MTKIEAKEFLSNLLNLGVNRKVEEIKFHLDLSISGVKSLNFHVEDDGVSISIESDEVNTDESIEKGLFIKLQSWDESKQHVDFRHLIGKQLEVIIKERE